MSLRRKLTSVRGLALTSCLLAYGAYAAFMPSTTGAQVAPMTPPGGGGVICLYGGQRYSEGACRGGQRCTNNGSGGGIWVDDTGCQ